MGDFTVEAVVGPRRGHGKVFLSTLLMNGFLACRGHDCSRESGCGAVDAVTHALRVGKGARHHPSEEARLAWRRVDFSLAVVAVGSRMTFPGWAGACPLFVKCPAQVKCNEEAGAGTAGLDISSLCSTQSPHGSDQSVVPLCSLKHGKDVMNWHRLNVEQPGGGAGLRPVLLGEQSPGLLDKGV